jgi:hypothetical protein
MAKWNVIVLILFGALFISSCDIVPIDTQFIADPGNGRWELITNDSDYYNTCFWAVFGCQSPYVAVDFMFSAEKKSGSDRVPYGAYFTAARGGSANGPFSYTAMVLINAAGQYTILTYDDQSGQDLYTVLVDWTSSSYLNTGYNVINRVREKYNQISENYDIYFNGYLANSLSYTSVGWGGDFGPLLFVGSQAEEDFPGTPVDVRIDL